MVICEGTFSERGRKVNKRIYICHTFYHVYIACLKELNLSTGERGRADLLLSTMSNDFGNLQERAQKSGLFGLVLPYEEKEEAYFPQLAKYHKDRGNLLLNMIARIRYTKMFGRLQAPFVPVDLKKYEDIYVFCDSDPIGYYLNAYKIPYHAVEDGLDCIRYYDTARYDNRGHFELKAWMAARNLIFIQNGYSKYCIDMEVNNIACLPYPCKKYIEKPREELTENLTDADKKILVSLFMENYDTLEMQLQKCNGAKKALVLTEPLCSLDVREQIFRDIIEGYCQDCTVIMKPHPRDVLDYKALFPEQIVIEGKFPMEVLNYIPGVTFEKVVSVFTVPDAIKFAGEVVFLGEDFMDKYEAPEIHRQNEMI